jgi:hypothetical protein
MTSLDTNEIKIKVAMTEVIKTKPFNEPKKRPKMRSEIVKNFDDRTNDFKIKPTSLKMTPSTKKVPK